MKFTTTALITALAAGTHTWTFEYPGDKICGLDMKTGNKDPADLMSELFIAELLCHPSNFTAKVVLDKEHINVKDKTMIEMDTKLTATDNGTTIVEPILFGPANITYGVSADCGLTADKYNVTIGHESMGTEVIHPVSWFAVSKVKYDDTAKQLTLSIAESNTTRINVNTVVRVSAPGTKCTVTGPITLGLYSTPIPRTSAAGPAVLASAALTLGLAAGLFL